MSYNNLSVQVTSTTGTWNGSSFSYNAIALDSGIPDIDQIEVERIFDLTTITTDSSGGSILPIATNISTVDLRKIYLLDKTNYTLNAINHNITAFNVTSPQKTYTFTTGNLAGETINIPAVTNGQTITVRRKTYSLGAYVTWVAGSRLTSEQLNSQVTQLVKIVQELLYKLDSEFVKKTDFLATDAASLSASSNINMQNNYLIGLNPSGTYISGYAVPMDYVNNMGFRHGVITRDTTPTNSTDDINIASTATEGRSGIWFDPEDGRLKVWAGNAWVVATAASRGPGVVQLTGTQSISGAKTFLNTVAMDQSATVGADLTITNNLTVDTNTLHVNASTNRVGIGITSPTRKLHLHESTAATNNYISITNSTTGTTSTDGLVLGVNTLDEGILWNFENKALVFGTNNTERVRILADGNVGINTSLPATPLHVNGTIRYTNRPSPGTITPIGFDANGDLKESSSSLRYKKDIVTYTKGLSEIMSLRPVTFSFNDETRTNAGFIAEEVDSQGLSEFMLYNDQNQPEGVLYANMVALLTKAIQELKAIVDAQAQRITILEGAINA